MATITSASEALTIRLGSDTKFPISGSFKLVSGIEMLIQDIEQLLLTIPGERVFRPTFGCNLRNQVWENIETAASDGSVSIRSALGAFEPRISVLEVLSEINENSGLITFFVQFVIRDTDQAVNLIFPFRTGTDLSFN